MYILKGKITKTCPRTASNNSGIVVTFEEEEKGAALAASVTFFSLKK